LPNIDKSKPTFGPLGRLFRLQRVVIFALAGLLVFYHTYTLFDLYVRSGTDLYGGSNANGYSWYARTQSILRLLIIVSLVFVAMNRRSALYGMWVGIGALVATHYWAYFFDLPFPFVEGRHPLSYLKGFIIPTVITLLHLSTNSRRNLRGHAA
jgi:Na+/proline symporter